MVPRPRVVHRGTVRAMPQFIPYAPQEARSTTAPPPLVRLALRGPDGKDMRLEFRQDSLLIGSTPGCDIQLSGGSVPLLVAIATVVPGGLRFRALQPGLTFRHNGQPTES